MSAAPTLPLPLRAAAPLRDEHGRQLTRLRLSLLDACNFRCAYCMPAEPVFLPYPELLSPAEIMDTCTGLVRLGIRQIRMTGGEPTLRRDFDEIALALSRLPLEKLALTTNALLLDQKLDLLADTRCRHINISLDSLRPSRFAEITRSTGFERVHRNVLAARARGFQVKLNVVVMRGCNDDELLEFVEFSARHDIPVRFLELMKIGPRHREFEALFVPAAEMLDRIGLAHRLTPVPVSRDSTAFVFRTAAGAEIGFIASESRPFCSTCSRLRLSANGWLRACLMSERGMNVRGLSAAELGRAARAVLRLKPRDRLPHIEQAMYQIGG